MSKEGRWENNEGLSKKLVKLFSTLKEAQHDFFLQRRLHIGKSQKKWGEGGEKLLQKNSELLSTLREA
jgi:hypothetical protein